jgi:hypothetical protein
MTRNFIGILFPLILTTSSGNAATNSSAGAGNIAIPVNLLSDREFLLTILLLVFGLVIIGVEYMLVRNRRADKVEDVSKLFVVTLIIIGTLILIGAGLSNDQIAPAIGLFGTIAGYLLGRSDQRQARTKDEDAKDAN